MSENGVEQRASLMRSSTECESSRLVTVSNVLDSLDVFTTRVLLTPPVSAENLSRRNIAFHCRDHKGTAA